ncbi:MAG TPA: NADH:flavin oxidoreductase/NADH oxidase, partial [Quisquiliibacterium sp.]|nr:NADH:flavin oxidoreductase/NADH oxidase [Quisquiliibacterium sp.]
AADERSPVPRALERAEIAGVVEAFGKAAARAHAAGFDIVEIHGAHGFLIHEFLSPVANQRTDDYGGSERNRMRFAIEVVQAVRAHWPQDKPLFLRLSAEDDAGWGPAQSVALAKEVGPMGVDVIDCSSGGILGKAPSVAPAYDYQVPYAERIRREAGVMTMAVGLIVHAQQAERILQEGRADLVALAREMLYNPNWAMDAAQKLGFDPKFEMLPPPYQYWLSRRAATVPDMVPSTFGPGELPG